MIQVLNSTHEYQARRLLAQAPAFNIYMLGNIATLGFDESFCQFWGDFNEKGELRAVLNRYMNGWVIYGERESDWEGLCRVIDEHPIDAVRLQDNPGGIDSVLPYLRRYEPTSVLPEELLMLRKPDFAPVPPPPDVEVRRATPDDLDALVKFYADAGEMTRGRTAVEQPLRHRRIWFAEVGGNIVATALTNAEVAGMAMVGGVFTAPAWRGRGISKALCSALCTELLAQGWQPILYWDAPAAGAVYHRLGFHPVGIWRSVRLRRTEEA